MTGILGGDAAADKMRPLQPPYALLRSTQMARRQEYSGLEQ